VGVADGDGQGVRGIGSGDLDSGKLHPNHVIHLALVRVSDADHRAALASTTELRETLHAAMREHAIDLWATPAATGPAPESQRSTGDPSMNLPWTHAGLPTLTLPAGTSPNGLPLGLQLSARFDDDETLLAWAAQLETML